MASPELGVKQLCPNCSAKFYDLNRRPATCPKCGESFDPEEAVRNRRVRARAAPADYETDDEKDEDAVDTKKKVATEDEDGFEEEPDLTPEIDDEAAAEPIETDDEEGDAAPAAPADDLGVDFAEDEDLAEDEADDVPFLEDEDEDDFPDDEIDGLPGEGDEDV
ncbi:TIGR02300 family protein [Caulobacter sp. SLTY]|uniref:TIGR02300 family protein n=1 Tax=Caulobacter sp. SLTY TaxID=2683262 RepID=UPI001412C024|nr:TIGR02300 family protein [Caulobacter sp. SLTY]NBB14141.1 TIGR02300 family protein [Caulobacter sp. SLTY]